MGAVEYMRVGLARLDSIDVLAVLRRPPSVYLLVVILTGAQLVAFVVSGTVCRVSTGGSAIMLMLLLALALRSRIAWALLALMNAIQLLATLAALLPVSGTGSANLQWGHIVVMLLTGAALEATFLSPAMRQYVRTPVWRDGDEPERLHGSS